MPKNNRSFVVYDIETNGTSYQNGHEIVQIAALTINPHDFSINEEVGEFEVVLQPQTPEKADPKAIEVIGQDLWNRAKNEGVHPKVGLRKFKEYLDKTNMSGKFYHAPILAGFNICGFDNPFTQHYMLEYKVVSSANNMPWAYLSYDLLPMMHAIFGGDDMKNHKLDTYLEMFGIGRSSSTHDALEDVRQTAQLFIKYNRFMRKIRPKIKIDKITEETADPSFSK